MALNRPQTLISANVRFGSKADMCGATRHVRLVPEADIRSQTMPHQNVSIFNLLSAPKHPSY
jgi:hypothetical protein